VKKVKVALCMLEIATGFTPRGPKCLEQGEIRKRGKGKSPWEKVQIGRERPHFSAAKPPKSFVGSLPPAQRLVPFLFPTVTKTSDEEHLVIDSCQ